jgi:hypothetical protein
MRLNNKKDLMGLYRFYCSLREFNNFVVFCELKGYKNKIAWYGQLETEHREDFFLFTEDEIKYIREFIHFMEDQK